MSSTAGKKTTLEISLDSGSTWHAIAGIEDIGSFAPSKMLLDKTYFGTSGAKDKFVGLADGKMSPKGDYINTDTNGQLAVIAAYNSEATVRLRVLWDGVAGAFVDGIIPNYKIDSQVAAKVTFTFDFEWTTQPTAV